VLLAVWLYATLEGIGAARAIERLSEHAGEPRHAVGIPPRQRAGTGPVADPEPAKRYIGGAS
jgi:hypothetical protein